MIQPAARRIARWARLVGARISALPGLARLARVGGVAGLLGLGFVGTLGSGCGGAPPTGTMRLELGTVDDTGTYVDLVDGQDVVLEPGAQGGFHVWMKFRLEAAAAQRLQVKRRAVRTSDGALVLRSSSAASIEPTSDGSWESPRATPMFMCPSPIGISIIDEPIRFEIDFVRTNDDADVVVSGSITLVPRCPPDKVDFCQRICTG